MDILAKEFKVLAISGKFDRVKIKFDKPLKRGCQVEVFKDGSELVNFNCEDGLVEEVRYASGRQDRFENGVLDRIKDRDGGLLIKKKGNGFDVQIEDLQILDNKIYLGLDPFPGLVSNQVSLLQMFVKKREFEGQNLEKERVEFRIVDNKVVVTVGKGKKSTETTY